MTTACMHALLYTNISKLIMSFPFPSLSLHHVKVSIIQHPNLLLIMVNLLVVPLCQILRQGSHPILTYIYVNIDNLICPLPSVLDPRLGKVGLTNTLKSTIISNKILGLFFVIIKIKLYMHRFIFVVIININ